MYKILVLNPGSTSTKVAYYEDSVNVCEQNLAVDRKVISGMKNIFDQMDLRKETIQKFLDEEHIDPKELSFIVSRGGGGGNLRAGGYIIDEALVQQQRTASTEAHFAWLVPLLEEYYDPMYRYQLGKKAGKILFRGSWQEVAAWLAK